jgi:large subunit GTPase 1
MKKNKNAKGKNQNVLSKLEKAVNKTANPHFNKKSKVENFDKDLISLQESKGKLKSRIEGPDSIMEFNDLANLTNKKYEVISENEANQGINTINIMPINESSNIIMNNILKNSDLKISNEVQFLSIPKKPKYKKGMKKDEYIKMEKESFLAWRKALAEEEMKNINKAITPYEKNIEVWKQLWMTVEKGEILFQIVDGRNPLYYRCPDLEKYIKEVDKNKEIILIVNKADLMNDDLRKNWADYFKTHNIKYIFFSAVNEIEKMEKGESLSQPEKIDQSDYRIFTRNELVQYIKEIGETIQKEEKSIENKNNNKSKNQANNALMVGFIGYPNVGKSSIINVLMKTKKAAVANIPGRTKHYQTLFLPEEQNLNILPKSICLVDCPGLIFPSFTTSKADMLVNGIYPIDTLSDIYNPIQIIINLIPSKILSNFYKITLPDIYSAKQFLQIIAKKRGFYTGNGLPEEAKTAKLILRDYTSGKLLYCHLRPDYTEEKFGKISTFENNIELTKEEKENHKLIENIPANFDDNYEKLYAENEQILENKKIIGDNVDNNFFVEQNFKNEKDKELENKPLTKEMKREIKFAIKRGDIDEEEAEAITNVKDYEEFMEMMEKTKNKLMNNKERDFIKTRGINIK